MLPASLANMFFSAQPLYFEATDNSQDATSQTTYSFTSQNIGNRPSATRRIIVCVGGYRDAGGAVSSATINGVAATIHVSDNSAYQSMAIISAVVPTGTSVTIAITWSISQAACGIAVFAMDTGNASSLYTSGSDYAGALSVSVSPPARSVTIAAAIRYYASAITWTWGGTLGATEYSDAKHDATSMSSAYFTTDSAASGTITATPSAGTVQESLQYVVFS